MKLGEPEIIFLDALRDSKKPLTRDRFAEMLDEKGFPSSQATITRIIKNVNEDFDMDIVNVRGVYRMEGEELKSDAYLQEVWEDYEYYRNKFYMYALLQSKAIDRRQPIVFDNSSQNRNIQYLKPILKANEQLQKIRIDYQRFGSEEMQTYIVNPLMIKEYLNRWYVIGDAYDVQKETSTENRSFAIDRIEYFEVLEERFEAKDLSQLHYQFSNCIGFPWEKTEVEEVRIWVSKAQYPYLKTLKLHHSQREIEHTEDGVIIGLSLICNFELEQRILFQGEHMEVLAPLYLRENIAQRLQKSLERYQK
jgi:predicted DNA-binding transcriptional regulator YafY